ncbi:MAG: MBL fold metallo-hydrolase [Brevinematia bacterium]
MKQVKFKGEKLELKNSGYLSLFFVGVGSAFTKRNFQTNLLIIKGDTHLLVDCGTKCPQALYNLGLSVTDIENYLITHSHADHIGGLEEVALVNRYFAHKKPTMIINETYQHLLWDMSLRGGCAYSEEKAGAVLTFSDFFNILRPKWLSNYPRETLEINLGTLNIKMFRTKHIPDSSDSWETSFWSCGIIIDDRVLFTSDTRYDPDLIIGYDKMFKLEVFFHDCQFFNGGVHASLEEIKELPAEIKSRMYLSHYGDNWEKFEDKIKEYGFKGLTQQNVFYNFD